MSNQRFRMPTVFGPTPGPRSGPNQEVFDYSHAPRTTLSVSYLSTKSALGKFLPPGFEIYGEPVVSVEWTTLHQLEWLAGREYRMLGVKYNAVFKGLREEALGPFLAVLWENRPEPIMSGREELGFAKLYCELPEQRILRGERHVTAAWDNHPFMQMRVCNLQTAPVPKASTDTSGSALGMLHYRYFPKLSGSKEPEISETVLTPALRTQPSYQVYQRGTGTVEFLESSWEQLPTMSHIVNALRSIPVLESRGALYSESTGGSDLSDQRVIL